MRGKMGGILLSTMLQGPALLARDAYLQLKTVRPISPSAGAKNNTRFSSGTDFGLQNKEKKAPNAFVTAKDGLKAPKLGMFVDVYA
ncbi:MAG: hypothetical protein Q7T16_03265 [Candidatus Burarchaeum sp.]|nr:hypothetical protein [Candidatus Burarchaeum sp.]MDO8339652.1 hypothetical protein [Candidatus Burarchaeum sp.]